MPTPLEPENFVRSHCPDTDLLVSRLREWCDCNSGSYNLTGLAKMADLLKKRCKELTDDVQLIDVPASEDIDPITGKTTSTTLGQALRARKRPEAPVQILLNGHMDTVYSADSPFQTCHVSEDGSKLHGPGVADMKGGLLVMLEALDLLEKHPEVKNIGWEVLVISDEEIGSHGGDVLLRESAERNDLGLIYESSPPGGSLVRSRMGSGNFLLRAHGRSVHVGKNFTDGRSAIVAIAEAVLAIQECNQLFEDARFNVGKVAGGEVLNAVAEHAHARFNIRYQKKEDAEKILTKLEEIREQIAAKHDVEMHLHGNFSRPAKVPDKATEALMHFIEQTGKKLGQNFAWHDTGGGADGSNLLAHGLPNIDSLGVIGGELHSSAEFMEINSLQDRIQLSALLLIRMAHGELPHTISSS